MQFMNIVLDGYSLLISLIMLCNLCGKRKDKLRRGFIQLCACNCLMILGDLTNWMAEGHGKPWYPAALRGGTFFFWICSSLIMLAFTWYFITYLSPKITVHPGFWRIATVMCAIHIICCLLSLWNGMFFTITRDNRYQRGSWFWLSQLIPILMYGLDVMIFARYRNHLNRKDVRILSSYIILPLAAEVFQMFHYGVALLNTGITVSLLLIFVNIQAEQELRLERQERELAAARVDIMVSQIKPHFLYNTMTAIRRLCDSNPGQAKEAILDLTLFLRANMDSLGSKAPIPFDQELKHTESYLNLERRRHRDRLHVAYEITVRDFFIPPLTVQPIMENAVRYGALSREEGGTVWLRTKETDHAYQITIQDDGAGFCMEPDSVEIEKRNHIGIANVRERLAVLCGGALEIQSISNVGTTVVITIPKEDDRVCGFWR